MAQRLVSVIHDLEAAVAGGDPLKRRAMLRDVTSLFAGQAERLDEAQVAAFDAVILRLALDIETQARAELSERLAGIANAPHGVVRDLAYDTAPAVASPVLRRSARLDVSDLVAIAETRGQAHLMAITQRATLCERVTDVIVRRGDEETVRSVAGNAGAAFSQGGYAQLMDRATDDDVLQARLQARADIPPGMRTQLVALAKAKAETTLGLEFGAAGTEAAAKAGRDLLQRDDAVLAADVFVSMEARKHDLDEATIARWLNEGRETEALVGLARIAGVPTAMTIQAYRAESYEPLLFVLRASRLGWRLMKQFLTVRAGRVPAPEVVQGIMEAFQALSVATAQRVVRFTAARDFPK